MPKTQKRTIKILFMIYLVFLSFSPIKGCSKVLLNLLSYYFLILLLVFLTIFVIHILFI